MKGPAMTRPSARLQKLLDNTHRPGPYEITDELVIEPLTKQRRDDLNDCVNHIAGAQAQLQQLASHILPSRPQYPMLPEPVGDKATTRQVNAHKAAVDNHKAAVTDWENLNAEWEEAAKEHAAAIESVSNQITEQSDRYTKALFGDVYEAVTDFFSGQPPELWDAFQTDIQQHFKIIPTPPEVPEDGRCKACGKVVDEEAAGKVPESSDSSNTTGTPSTVTSPDET